MDNKSFLILVGTYSAYSPDGLPCGLITEELLAGDGFVKIDSDTSIFVKFDPANFCLFDIGVYLPKWLPKPPEIVNWALPTKLIFKTPEKAAFCDEGIIFNSRYWGRYEDYMAVCQKMQTLPLYRLVVNKIPTNFITRNVAHLQQIVQLHKKRIADYNENKILPVSSIYELQVANGRKWKKVNQSKAFSILCS